MTQSLAAPIPAPAPQRQHLHTGPLNPHVLNVPQGQQVQHLEPITARCLTNYK